MPAHLVARLLSCGPDDVSLGTRRLRPLLATRTPAITPGIPIRNLSDFLTYATTSGITINAGIKPAR